MPYLIDTLPPWSTAEKSADAAGLPAETLAPLERLYRRLAAAPLLTALTLECLNALAVGNGKTDCGQAFFHDAELERWHFLLILLSHPAAEYNYREAKYPREIFHTIWQDLARWGQFYLKLYGELRLGANEFAWFFLHLSARLIQLGRLQFELPRFYGEGVSLEPPVAAGAPVIALHIHSGEPLTPAGCRESLHRLKRWLPQYRPEYRFHAVISHSWLYGPELEELLPEHSNIREFRKLGHLFPDTAPSDILWRLFNGRNPEKYDAPLTSLQRSVLDWYHRGNIVHYGLMVITAEELAES